MNCENNHRSQDCFLLHSPIVFSGQCRNFHMDHEVYTDSCSLWKFFYVFVIGVRICCDRYDISSFGC